MRDYITHPCQTNLELYEQMEQSKFYTVDDIKLVDEAYFFALSKVNGMYRGSGKPFICHLVGTCSILAAVHASITVLITGILHAVYQMRVGFESENQLENRRQHVLNRFGKQIDEMIFLYDEFEKKPITDNFNNDTEKNVFIIHLADTLEDFAGKAIFFRGAEKDDENTLGGFENKLAYYKKQADILVKQANSLGVPMLGVVLENWIFNTPYNSLPVSMRKGYYSSFRINEKE